MAYWNGFELHSSKNVPIVPIARSREQERNLFLALATAHASEVDYSPTCHCCGKRIRSLAFHKPECPRSWCVDCF